MLLTKITTKASKWGKPMGGFKSRRATDLTMAILCTLRSCSGYRSCHRNDLAGFCISDIMIPSTNLVTTQVSLTFDWRSSVCFCTLSINSWDLDINSFVKVLEAHLHPYSSWAGPAHGPRAWSPMGLGWAGILKKRTGFQLAWILSCLNNAAGQIRVMYIK